jgi:putative two-component system response regulator
LNSALLIKLIALCEESSDVEHRLHLANEVDASLSALLSSREISDFELLNRACRHLAPVDWELKHLQTAESRALNGLAPVAYRVLLNAAISHIARASPEHGIRWAERALEIALALSLREEARRAYNVCSALYMYTGAASDSIDYGLRSAVMARELEFPIGVVGALTNVIMSLILIGLFGEAIEMAERVYTAYSDRPECSPHVALVLGNAAHAALSIKNYSAASGYARRSLALQGSVTSDQSANDHLIDELTWLKCAIALDQKATAHERMLRIDVLADAHPTPQIELNRRLARALHMGYVKGAQLATIGELGYLRVAAANFTTIYVDVVQQLASVCSKAGDDASALFYVSELVDTVGHARLGKVREQIALLGQNLKTVAPEKNSTQEIIDRIVSHAGAPKPSRERIDSLAPTEMRLALERLAATAKLCDDPSRRSIYRVGALAGLLALEIGYSASQAFAVEHAARLHDIGKLGLPTAIFAKPERFNASEFEVMTRHTALGAQILSQCNEPVFDLAAEIAWCHHEQWDGTGYPRNLQGEAIPEVARIVALAETYDAMTHRRSYRHRHTHPETVEYLRKNAGNQFDPNITSRFIRMIERLRETQGEQFDAFLSAAMPSASKAHARAYERTLLPIADLVPLTVVQKLLN